MGTSVPRIRNEVTDTAVGNSQPRLGYERRYFVHGKNPAGRNLRKRFLLGGTQEQPQNLRPPVKLPSQARCAIRALHCLFGGSKCLMFRLAAPVCTLQAPVLQNNRK